MRRRCYGLLIFDFDLYIMTITLAIIVVTAIISVMSLNNQKIEDDLIFDPPAITYRKQWYRFITSGFIHADYLHLGFNMFSFYAFGESVEFACTQIFGFTGKLIYILLYLTSLVTCLLPTYSQHKENYGYRALGASGAISAVSFCFILLFPKAPIGIIFLPFVKIPAFLFGPLYLLLSSALAKRAHGTINHSAHFWGALYGVAFLIVTCYVLSDYPLLSNFYYQIAGYYSGH